MNNILVMQYCKAAKGVPDDLSPYGEWDIFLGEVKYVVGCIVINND